MLMDTNHLLAGLGTGLSGGLLAGLFGVGGGLVMVPLLGTILGLDQHRAQGATLAAIAITLPLRRHFSLTRAVSPAQSYPCSLTRNKAGQTASVLRNRAATPAQRLIQDRRHGNTTAGTTRGMRASTVLAGSIASTSRNRDDRTRFTRVNSTPEHTA